MTFFPADRRIRLCLIVILVCAAFFRFYRIDSIPGFDHDEALICLGARTVADMSDLPMTGDKVYESPTLEYLGGLAFIIFGSSDTVIRILIGCIGLLGVVSVIQIGRFVFGDWSGVFAGILMALSPWAIASSRVIYASNLVVGFLPLSVMSFILWIESRQRSWIISTGLFLGLAAGGRITVLVFWIPFLIGMLFTRNRRSASTVSAVALSLLPVTSMIGFNFMNGWPAIQVFTDPAQSHSLPAQASLADAVSRVIAYLSSMLAAVDGSRFWVDVNREGSMWIQHVILVVAAAGLMRTLLTRSAKSLLVLAMLCLPVLIVPITTKTIQISAARAAYHPHYLDMMMPWVFLILGSGIDFFLMGIVRLSGFRWINYVICPLIILLVSIWLVLSIYPFVQYEGGPGRWNNRYERLAEAMEKNPAYRLDVLVIDNTFGMGLPQMKFLLPQSRITPSIGPFTGIMSTDGAMRDTPVIALFDSSHLNLFSRTVPGSMVTRVDDSCIAYRYKSPGLTCDATFDLIEMPGMRLTIECDEAVPPGVSGRIADFKGNEERFRLIRRVDTYEQDPTFRQTAERVSRRHQQSLAVLADRLSVVSCSGMTTGENSPVTVTFRNDGTFWHCHYQSDRREISGTLLGDVLFF